MSTPYKLRHIMSFLSSAVISRKSVISSMSALSHADYSQVWYENALPQTLAHLNWSTSYPVG